MKKIHALAAVIVTVSAVAAIMISTAIVPAFEACAGNNIFAGLKAPRYKIVNIENNSDKEKLIEMLDENYEHFRKVISGYGFRLEEPQQPLEWIIFDSHPDFEDYAIQADKMDTSTLDAYYSTRTNRVAIVGRPSSFTYRDCERITHEAAHQLAFNTGIQKRGVMYPFWVSEGLATNFENEPSGRCGLDGTCSGRLARFAESAETFMPLEDFIVMTQLPRTSREECLKIYAQAWGVFNFLLKNYPTELRSFLRAMTRERAGRNNPEMLRSAFEKAFGDIEDIKAAWENYIDDTIQREQQQSAEKTQRASDARDVFWPAEARFLPFFLHQNS